MLKFGALSSNGVIYGNISRSATRLNVASSPYRWFPGGRGMAERGGGGEPGS